MTTHPKVNVFLMSEKNKIFFYHKLGYFGLPLFNVNTYESVLLRCIKACNRLRMSSKYLSSSYWFISVNIDNICHVESIKPEGHINRITDLEKAKFLCLFSLTDVCY